jgi:hypothetical protein
MDPIEQKKPPVIYPILPRHLIAFVVYTTAGFVLGPFLFFPVFFLLLWIPHGILLIIRGFVQFILKHPREAGQHILTGIILFIIGFGMCAVTSSSGFLDSMFSGL